MSKYNLGLNQTQFVDTKNLLEDLNAKTDAIRYEVAQGSLTLLTEARFTASRNDYAEIPLTAKQKKIAYVGIGTTELNAFGKRMKDDLMQMYSCSRIKTGKKKQTRF